MVPRESLEDIISKVVRLSNSRRHTNISSFCEGTLLQRRLGRQRVTTWHVCGFLSSQWQENPGLLESQVQAVAMAQQATLEMEFKRREAVYRDVLNRQQSVRTRKPGTKRPGVFGPIEDENDEMLTNVFRKFETILVMQISN